MGIHFLSSISIPYFSSIAKDHLFLQDVQIPIPVSDDKSIHSHMDEKFQTRVMFSTHPPEPKHPTTNKFAMQEFPVSLALTWNYLPH
jgi:hypothetical protein